VIEYIIDQLNLEKVRYDVCPEISALFVAERALGLEEAHANVELPTRLQQCAREMGYYSSVYRRYSAVDRSLYRGFPRSEFKRVLRYVQTRQLYYGATKRHSRVLEPLRAPEILLRAEGELGCGVEQAFYHTWHPPMVLPILHNPAISLDETQAPSIKECFHSISRDFDPTRFHMCMMDRLQRCARVLSHPPRHPDGDNPMDPETDEKSYPFVSPGLDPDGPYDGFDFLYMQGERVPPLTPVMQTSWGTVHSEDWAPRPYEVTRVIQPLSLPPRVAAFLSKEGVRMDELVEWTVEDWSTALYNSSYTSRVYKWVRQRRPLDAGLELELKLAYRNACMQSGLICRTDYCG